MGSGGIAPEMQPYFHLRSNLLENSDVFTFQCTQIQSVH